MIAGSIVPISVVQSVPSAMCDGNHVAGAWRVTSTNRRRRSRCQPGPHRGRDHLAQDKHVEI